MAVTALPKLPESHSGDPRPMMPIANSPKLAQSAQSVANPSQAGGAARQAARGNGKSSAEPLKGMSV
jgi:hypothetical protein